MNKESLYLQLEDYFKKQGIEEDGIQRLREILWCRSLKKGEIVLEMGEKSQYICFILQGIVRGVYISEDGDEVTKCFSKEGDWCCVYSMMKDTPSEYLIETLEDSILACFPISEVKEFLKERFDAQKMYADLCQKSFVLEQERSVGFLKNSASERYLEMGKEQPELLKRVDQKYIASYLGVTPSSLSRIRRILGATSNCIK